MNDLLDAVGLCVATLSFLTDVGGVFNKTCHSVVVTDGWVFVVEFGVNFGGRPCPSKESRVRLSVVTVSAKPLWIDLETSLHMSSVDLR